MNGIIAIVIYLQNENNNYILSNKFMINLPTYLPTYIHTYLPTYYFTIIDNNNSNNMKLSSLNFEQILLVIL